MYDHRLSPSLRPLAGATHLRAVTLPVRPGWRAGDPQVCYHTRQNRNTLGAVVTHVELK